MSHLEPIPTVNYNSELKYGKAVYLEHVMCSICLFLKLKHLNMFIKRLID